MRTTLDIADDVLFAAKDYARRDKKTLGEVISEWGRTALQASTAQINKQNPSKRRATPETDVDRAFRELGFKPFPSRAGGGLVTNEMINRIRDEEGI
jgi:hypothetical protein